MRFLSRLSLQWQIIAGVVPDVALLLLMFGWLAERTARDTQDLALEGRLATANASAHAIDEILLHEAEELQEAAEQLGLLETEAAERELMEPIGAVIDEYHVIMRLSPGGEALWAVPARMISRPGRWPGIPASARLWRPAG